MASTPRQITIRDRLVAAMKQREPQQIRLALDLFECASGALSDPAYAEAQQLYFALTLAKNKSPGTNSGGASRRRQFGDSLSKTAISPPPVAVAVSPVPADATESEEHVGMSSFNDLSFPSFSVACMLTGRRSKQADSPHPTSGALFGVDDSVGLLLRDICAQERRERIELEEMRRINFRSITSESIRELVNMHRSAIAEELQNLEREETCGRSSIFGEETDAQQKMEESYALYHALASAVESIARSAKEYRSSIETAERVERQIIMQSVGRYADRTRAQQWLSVQIQHEFQLTESLKCRLNASHHSKA